MACRYSLELRVDYFATFSPTVTLNAICILIAIENFKGWHLHSIDVCTAFLHAPLDDVECYMAVRAGLDVLAGLQTNCVRLRKAVYGLKQAPREWHHTVVEFSQSHGFRQLY